MSRKIYGSTVTTPISPEKLKGDGKLPSVSAEDNGKILQVVDGAWAVADAPSGGSVPSYTGEVEVG